MWKQNWSRAYVKSNESKKTKRLSCWHVPTEPSLINREIGSLHVPPPSLILLILRCQGIRPFSPQKRKPAMWTKHRCVRTHQIKRKTFYSSHPLKLLRTCSSPAAYSFLSGLQYITNDSSNPSTPLYYPEGWRNLPNWYRSSPYLSHYGIWQPTREL